MGIAEEIGIVLLYAALLALFAVALFNLANVAIESIGELQCLFGMGDACP